MLTECCQSNSEKDFTSFIINHCSGGLLHNFNVKAVHNVKKTLVQDPCESFIINFVPRKDCVIKDFINAETGNYHCLMKRCYIHTYDLLIIFDDNHGEAVYNSSYDIILNASIEENGQHYHRQLFSYKKVCNANKIDLPFQVLYFTQSEEIKLMHLCITMRRSICNNNPCIAKEECHLGKFLYSTLGKRKLDDDISLIVGSDIFQAHKAILSKRSPVFAAMFSNDMLEKHKDLVRINGFEPCVVQEMLYYMYTLNVQNMSQNAHELFKIAHQYDIPDLCKKCEEYLEANIGDCSLLNTLKIANQYNLEKLKADVMVYLNSNEERLARDGGYLADMPNCLEVSIVAYAFKFCAKYNLNELLSKVFDFANEHRAEVARNQEFLDLYGTHTELMRAFFQHVSLK